MQASAQAGTAPRHGFRSILYPTDLGVDGLGAFAHALRLALDGAGSLTMVHVAGGQVAWAAFPGLRTTLVRWGALADGVPREAVAALGISATKLRIEAQNPVRGILHRARRGRADLLVLTSHPRTGIARVLRGSVSESVVARASVPCLVIPPGTRGFVQIQSGEVRLRRALVAMPPGAGGALAVEALRRLAATLRVDSLDVDLLFVDGPDLGSGAALGAPPGWTVRTSHGTGGLVEAVSAAIARDKPDLVAIGRTGRGGLLAADPAVRVIRHLGIPALVAPLDPGP